MNKNSTNKFPIKTSYLFDLVKIISQRNGTKIEFNEEDTVNLMLKLKKKFVLVACLSLSVKISNTVSKAKSIKSNTNEINIDTKYNI